MVQAPFPGGLRPPRRPIPVSFILHRCRPQSTIVQMQDLIREMHAAGRSPEHIQTAVTNEFGRMAFVVLPGIEPVIAELE
jgi:hypothetical protein